MPYDDVMIGESLGANNDFGKPITFLGVMKDNFISKGLSVWTDKRREIVLAIGKTTPDSKFFIGEVRKKDSEWKWVWGVPIEDIHGYEDMVKEIKKNKEGI